MLCVTNLLLHGIDKPLVFHDNSLTKDVLNYTEEDKFDVVLMNPPYGGNEKPMSSLIFLPTCEAVKLPTCSWCLSCIA